MMSGTTSPYFNDLGRPISVDSVIVIADILGYSQYVKAASQYGQFEARLGDIYHALTQSFPSVSHSGQTNWIAKVMSDTLLVAHPVSAEDPTEEILVEACRSIGHFQREMLTFRLPIRGGVSIGAIHVSDIMVFPEMNAFSELREAEAIAGSPRIVLLDSANQFLSEFALSFRKAQKSDLDDVLLVDDDSLKFVNYLRSHSRLRSKNTYMEIVAHKQIIEGGLEKFCQCQRIFLKYIWMAKYHNRFCRSVSAFNSMEFLVELAKYWEIVEQ